MRPNFRTPSVCAMPLSRVVRNLWLLFILFAPAFAADKLHIAVLPLVAKTGVEPGLAESIGELLISELVRQGRYELVDRANLAALLKEQALQNSGCTESACAVRLGNILNVQKMVVGTLSKIGDTLAVTIHLVDVERSSIEQSFRIEGNANTLGDETKSLAERMSASAALVASVIQIRPNDVLVNFSKADGALPGLDLQIFTNGEAVMDQTTGQLLDRETTIFARGRIVSLIGQNVSVVQILSNSRPLKIGDKVRFEIDPRGDLATAVTERPRPTSPRVGAPSVSDSVKGKLWAMGLSAGVAAGCLVTGLVLTGDADAMLPTYRSTYNSADATALGDKIQNTTAMADTFYTVAESGLALTAVFGIWALIESASKSPAKKNVQSPRVGGSLVPTRHGLALTVAMTF